MKNWQESFSEVAATPPVEGSVIKTLDGSDVKIIIDLIEGKEPFMYALVYVPTIVGTEIGWFARDVKDQTTYGLKAILLPKARNEIIRLHGLKKTVVSTLGLKVIRKSREGKSLLVELWKEPAKQVTPIFKAAPAVPDVTNEPVDIPMDVPSEATV